MNWRSWLSLPAFLLARFQGSAAQGWTYCEAPSPASWKYKHCALRNLYFDMISFGLLPGAEIVAGARIEREWQACVVQRGTLLPARELKATVANLRAQLWDGFVKEHGPLEARKLWLEQGRNLQMLLEAAGLSEAEEVCSLTARDAYLARVPSLSK